MFIIEIALLLAAMVVISVCLVIAERPVEYDKHKGECEITRASIVKAHQTLDRLVQDDPLWLEWLVFDERRTICATIDILEKILRLYPNEPVELSAMSNLMDARCTWPFYWRGYLVRPVCVVHEIEPLVPRPIKRRKK